MFTLSNFTQTYNILSNETKFFTSIIPNGTLGELTIIEYPVPINSKTPKYSNDSTFTSSNLIPFYSTFPAKLGNDSDTATLLGDLYYQLYLAGK